MIKTEGTPFRGTDVQILDQLGFLHQPVAGGQVVGQPTGVLRVVATMRFDAKYADENGVAKLINLGL